jgi:hypothetical protein
MRYNRRVPILPKLTPKREIYWRIYRRRTDAIAIILMCKDYFIKNRGKAEATLAMFEEAPYLRVASKEEAYRIKRESGL